MRGVWRMRNGKLAVVTSERGDRWHGALLMPVAWNVRGSFRPGVSASAYDLAERIAPIDDFLPVGDLLAEHGFDEVADFLRALANVDEPSA